MLIPWKETYDQPKLSHFSCVRLCATPEMAAHQAPLSLGFSRQEHWSGLPFPSPMHESEKWKCSRSSYPTLSDPMNCSLPGSSIHGIFQARVLEWGAIAFSNDQPRQHIRKQRHYFANKDLSSQGYGFSSSHVWIWELDYKEIWAKRIHAFELWCWRKLLRFLGLQGDSTNPA